MFFFFLFYPEFKKLRGEEQQSPPAVVCNDADVTSASENLDAGKTRQSRSANIFHQFVGWKAKQFLKAIKKAIMFKKRWM